MRKIMATTLFSLSIDNDLFPKVVDDGSNFFDY